MTAGYFNRLIAIGNMLQSPHPPTVEEGLGLLMELMRENAANPIFMDNVRAMANEHTHLEARILLMIDEVEGIPEAKLLEHAEVKKDSPEKKKSAPPKIFVSYAHINQKLMKRLVSMLQPYEKQGVFEIWYDCEILEGDEWYQEIQTAMNTCDMALLLISIDFLNSRFIQEEELPKLLQQRLEKGLRVIPIILKDCPWQSVPVLNGLKALPKDGKPVSSFNGTNQPDRVLAEIAMRIAELAKA